MGKRREIKAIIQYRIDSLKIVAQRIEVLTSFAIV